MRLGFYCSEKKRCRDFAAAFACGVRSHGDEITIYSGTHPLVLSIDAACILSLQDRALFDTFRTAQIPIIYLDKGYTRDGDYRRIAMGSTQPTSHLYFGAADDRRRVFGWEIKPWRSGRHILICASSYKYHAFHGLPDVESWGNQLVGAISHYSSRPIVFRGKPNLKPLPIQGVMRVSQYTTLQGDLKDAHVIITHGSSACLEAMREGVPSIVLGDAVTAPISSSSIHRIEELHLATDHERLQLLNDLAYCQYTVEEFRSGYAWRILRPHVLEMVYGTT